MSIGYDVGLRNIALTLNRMKLECVHILSPLSKSSFTVQHASVFAYDTENFILPACISIHIVNIALKEDDFSYCQMENHLNISVCKIAQKARLYYYTQEITGSIFLSNLTSYILRVY